PETGFKEKISHPAYPVAKLSGLLFAHMGPPEKKPLLPKWDVLVRQDGVKKVDICEVLRCNWLQAMENSVDPTHTYYLHSHTLKLKGNPDHVPFHYQQLSKIEFELVVEPTWAGIQKQRVFAGDGVPVEFVGTKNEAGEFHLDNFASQDHMAWETQGPLADRAREHLGESDRGIIMFRKLLRDQIHAVQTGDDPIGINRDPAKDEVIRL